MRLKCPTIILMSVLELFGLMSVSMAADGKAPHRVASEGDLTNLHDTASLRSSVQRLRIEYEVNLRRPGRGDGMINLTARHRILALGAPDEVYTFSAQSPIAGYPWTDDPYAQEYFIHHGTASHRWPFNRMFSVDQVQRGGSIPGSFNEDVLLPILPVWPIASYTVPRAHASGGAILIPGEALRTDEYEFVSSGDQIAGKKCMIFEKSGVDRIWIAAHWGICVMRRDFWDDRFGTIRQRILTDKVQEIRPGLWIPTEFRRQHFDLQPDSRGKEVLNMEEKVRIIRIDLNDQVPDSTFIATHPPGSLQVGEHDEFWQVTPGGEDHLVDIATFLVQYLDLPDSREALGRGVLLWAFVGFAGGVSIGVLLVRRI